VSLGIVVHQLQQVVPLTVAPHLDLQVDQFHKPSTVH
jgi:hypothetical protein